MLLVRPLRAAVFPGFSPAILFFFWLLTFLLLLCRILAGQLALRRMFRGNVPAEQPCAEAVFRDVLREFQLSGRVRLYSNDLISVPVLSGVFFPAVILPCRPYSPQELTMIFAHELTHLRRRDNLFRGIFLVLAAALWFFPPAWAAYRAFSLRGELACDEAVCRYAGNRSGQAAETRTAYLELLLRHVSSENDGIPDSSGVCAREQTAAAEVQGGGTGTAGSDLELRVRRWK